MNMSEDYPPPETLPAVKLAGPSESDQVPPYLRVKDKEIPSWYTATRTFSQLVSQFESENVQPGTLDDESYTRAWSNAAWHELYTIDKKSSDWAQQTVTLTFTGTYYLDSNKENFLPPVTFFERLRAAAPARRKALSRCLSDVPRWQSIRIIGTGPRGYPILHLGLYLSSQIEPKNLQPVINAHLNNCPIADRAAHSLKKTITSRTSPSHQSELVHGLGQKIPGLKSGEGITAESWQRRGTATAIRAGQWRPYSFGRST